MEIKNELVLVGCAGMELPLGHWAAKVIHLSHLPDLCHLPTEVGAGGLHIEELHIESCPNLQLSPNWKSLCELALCGMDLGQLAPGLHPSGVLHLRNCPGTHLPPGISTQRLELYDCPDLESLPADLEIEELGIDKCSKLQLPDGLRERLKSLEIGQWSIKLASTD